MINRLPLSPLSRSLALDLFTSRPSPSSPSLPTLSISRTRSHHSVSYSSTDTSTPIYAILTEPVQNACSSLSPPLSRSLRAPSIKSLDLSSSPSLTHRHVHRVSSTSLQLSHSLALFSLNLSSIYSFSTSISYSPNTFAHIGATSIIPITHGHNSYIMHTNTARTQM